MNWYARGGKRCFDVVVAAVLLVLTAPVMAMIALISLMTQGRPILFGQERAGRDGEIFTILKFRTMKPADVDGSVPRDRVTQMGRLLRKTSLDELPQLINVLRGHMSLVGPRPLYARYVPRYSAEHRRRLDVRPGVTGLVQVSGRNSLAWEERFDLDVQYVDSISLWNDLDILLRTAGAVLGSRRDAGSTSPSTEYLGSEPGDGG